MTGQETLDQRCINTIRFLAVDAVQRAQSGHPGTPMGAATTACTLWDHFLKHNPRNPAWPARDRLILSAGHASMLLYSLLHPTGYDLPPVGQQNPRPPRVRPHGGQRSGPGKSVVGAKSEEE